MLLSCSESDSVTVYRTNNGYIIIISLFEINHNHTILNMQLSGTFAADNRAEHMCDARTEPQATCVTQHTHNTTQTWHTWTWADAAEARADGQQRGARVLLSLRALHLHPAVEVLGLVHEVLLLGDLRVVLQVEEFDPVLVVLDDQRHDAVPELLHEGAFLVGVGDAVHDLVALLDLREGQRAQREAGLLEERNLQGETHAGGRQTDRVEK